MIHLCELLCGLGMDDEARQVFAVKVKRDEAFSQ